MFDLDEIDAQLDAAAAVDLPALAAAVARSGPRLPRPGGRTVRLGDFQVEAQAPLDRARAPFLPQARGVAFPTASGGTLEALRWMMQKGELGQDMFLLGEPGPELRHLVYLYCILLGKELEYVAITRDTSEADLKQRREIAEGCLRFVDQAPVRAAKAGRVLLLEGIEKAERNVLPTLNNLLENREMALEDRTFLAAPRRSGLADGHTPVSEHFQVVAIGQPGRGNPLDPPLRSRFVALELRPRGLRGSAAEELERLARCSAGVAPNEPPLPALRQLVALAELLAAACAEGAPRPHSGAAAAEAEGPPALPEVALGGLARLLAMLPQAPPRGLLLRAYPTRLLGLAAARAEAAERAMDSCGFGRGAADNGGYDDVWRLAPLDADPRCCTVQFCGEMATGSSVSIKVPCGPSFHLDLAVERPLAQPIGLVSLVKTQRRLVAAMMQDHAAGVDLCLVGERGVGKSILVRAFCEHLGYQPHVVFCYQDMVSRDLLQRRTTDSFGNTTWQSSPLLIAALRGQVAVLDGVHRLAKGMLYSALGRLLHDREVELADGSLLASPDHYERLLADGVSREELAMRRIGMVHPCFRVIAVAEPSAASGKEQWLTAEACGLFHFHEVPPLPAGELRELCLARGVDSDGEAGMRQRRAFDGLVSFASAVRQKVEHSEDEKELEAMALSLRQLRRAGQHLMAMGGDAAGAADRAFSARLHFLQPQTRERVNEMLAAAMRAANADAIRKLRRPGLEASCDGEQTLAVEADARVLRIGDVSCKVRSPSSPELVPDVEFVYTPQHVAALRQMLLDWSLGHHLLLVGNQGTGKNKLTDRLLQLLRCEREYVQLHRDTTVQSLLLAQSLEAGVVLHEDTAVVRALRHGRCLVVDEADKAPLEVVSVLKALADDGELTLGDGRCILRRGDPRLGARTGAEGGAEGKSLIETGEGFRLIVLANRPGFPFLGNDFFRVCGDVFSCHVVDNPNTSSELALLAAYGPKVPQDTLERLAALFAELRSMADLGKLTYPYSTRELVKAVRHLNNYPEDPLESVLADVFAFDLVDHSKRDDIYEVLRRHGLGVSPEGIELLRGRPHGDLQLELLELPAGE